MDVTAATDAFIDHFINPHYLINRGPELLLLSKNEMTPGARQDDEYDDDDDDDDDDFRHFLSSEARLSDADSASLLSDAITTPLLQDHAASAAIVSALTEEITSVQSSYCSSSNSSSNDGADADAIAQACASDIGGVGSSSASLDFIYHLLFYDLDRLLLESYSPLTPSPRQMLQQTISIITEPRTSSVSDITTTGGNTNSSSDDSKRRRDQQQPSAPFDMDAILRAQQEFIHKRQVEEVQAEQRGEKVQTSLPKRSRKRISHSDGGLPPRHA